MSGGFAGERVVVIGLGIAGAAAARVASEEGASVLVSEARPEVALPAELDGSAVELRAGGHEPDHLDGATVVVASPGVSPNAPVLQWATDRGIPIWGELELGARLCDAPYLAVTGTNGKTTTTAMLAACLRESGRDAVACGNIGHPFPVAAREGHEVLVVEASSFQLTFQRSFHPRVSVLLNLAPDHLDWHGSFEAYAGAKARVFLNQGAGDVHVGNRDDDGAARISRRAGCDIRWFTLNAPAPGEVGFVGSALAGPWEGTISLGPMTPDTPAMRADAAACAAAAHAFGVGPEAIGAALAGFVPARHRGETVATVGGVRFVDNSKATNPHATLAALGEHEGVVLIAGGDAKGVDLAPIAALAPRLAAVVAIGESAPEVTAIFRGRTRTRPAGSIEEAVRAAFELAPRGGSVLLAPACASWDMFRDYRERGDRFASAARALEEVRT